MALGLSSEDMVAVDHFMEELKEKHVVSSTATHIKTETEKDELRLKVANIDIVIMEIHAVSKSILFSCITT